MYLPEPEYINPEQNSVDLPFFEFNPYSIRRTYGVLLISENEQGKSTQIHYEIEIVCLKPVDNKNYIFEINKKQVFINQKAPNTVIEELADFCGKTLYPILLEVNKSGIPTAILNQLEIQRRWNKNKIIIEKSYTGNDVDFLLKNMEHTLLNIKNVKKLLLQRELFLNLFFKPIYNTSSQEDNNVLLELPLLPYNDLTPFLTKKKYTNHPYKKEDIILTLKGNYLGDKNDNNTLYNTKTSVLNEKISTGYSTINYQFYKESTVPDLISGSCVLDFLSGKRKTTTINIFHLKEKNPKTESERKKEEQITLENEPKPKKMKKKYFFFGKEL